MTDDEARMRRRILDQAVGGVLLFVIEVVVVLSVLVVALAVAALTLALA